MKQKIIFVEMARIAMVKSDMSRRDLSPQTSNSRALTPQLQVWDHNYVGDLCTQPTAAFLT
jgi:hypothetical protein